MSQEKDKYLNAYLSINENYADLTNFMAFDGRPVVDKDNLVDLDPWEFLSTEVLAAGYLERDRDLLKQALLKTDGKMTYLIIGLENQSWIDLRMPIRALTYDIIRYNQQLKALETKNNEQGYKGRSKDEFFSKFLYEDYLMPVVTLVVYYGSEKWQWSRNVRDLVRVEHEELLKFVPDYELMLLDVANEDAKSFDKLKTSLRFVFKALQASGDLEKFKQVIENEAEDFLLSKEAVQVINQFTGIEIKLDEAKEAIGMGEAGLLWKQELLAEGYAKGMDYGISQGIDQGITKGIDIGKTILIKQFLKNGITKEMVAQGTGLSVAEIEAIAAE